jgi:SAM-dependent methyltransferase
MNDSVTGGDAVYQDRPPESAVRYYKKDFWSEENLKFLQPHIRMEKTAQIVNRIARGKECDLLDLGCGPATLRHLLSDNIHYHGIDIAIHEPAPYLIEADFVEDPIKFDERQFDLIVAQGVFEYVGTVQSQKFAEIRQLLAKDGTFITSYWNFGHRYAQAYHAFSNIRSLNDFRKSLERYFTIDASFPASHNWRHGMPRGKLVKAINIHVNMNIPLVSPLFAVEYLFICSSGNSGTSEV